MRIRFVADFHRHHDKKGTSTTHYKKGMELDVADDVAKAAIAAGKAVAAPAPTAQSDNGQASTDDVTE